MKHWGLVVAAGAVLGTIGVVALAAHNAPPQGAAGQARAFDVALIGPAALPNTESAMSDLFRGLKADPRNVLDAQILPPDAHGEQIFRFYMNTNILASDLATVGTNLIAAGIPLHITGVIPIGVF